MNYTPLNGARVLISTDGSKSLAIDTVTEVIPVEQPSRVINLANYDIDIPALVETAMEMALASDGIGIGVAAIAAELPEERAQMEKLAEYINSSTSPIQLLLDAGVGNYQVLADTTRVMLHTGRVTQFAADMTLVYANIPITVSLIVDLGAQFTVLQITVPALALIE